MEAVLEDERLEHLDNAEAGLILAKYVHTREQDNRTGSGPCQFSSNIQFLECAQPLSLNWADLYGSWNLAFVSSIPDFIYYMPKLLIPTVSSYQDNPASYLYTRCLGLYTFIHWRINWGQYNEKIQWSDASLTKDWGSANKISKQDYVEKLAGALSANNEEVESSPRPNFPLGKLEFFWDSVWLPLMRTGPYNLLI